MTELYRAIAHALFVRRPWIDDRIMRQQWQMDALSVANTLAGFEKGFPRSEFMAACGLTAAERTTDGYAK